MVIIRKYSHTRALSHIIATANIRGWHSELPIVWLLFDGGNYLRVATIQRNVSVNALIWIAIWVAYPTSGCGWIWIRLWIVCVNSCWRGWKWIGCSMWSFSIFMISSQNKLFYLHHSINTLDNNPFVLTAVSSNVQELSHSLLLYGILYSCELSSGRQQKLWLNVLTVWWPSWPHHPLHPTPFSPWYQSLQVLAKAK